MKNKIKKIILEIKEFLSFAFTMCIIALVTASVIGFLTLSTMASLGFRWGI